MLSRDSAFCLSVSNKQVMTKGKTRGGRISFTWVSSNYCSYSIKLLSANCLLISLFSCLRVHYTSSFFLSCLISILLFAVPKVSLVKIYGLKREGGELFKRGF